MIIVAISKENIKINLKNVKGVDFC